MATLTAAAARQFAINRCRNAMTLAGLDVNTVATFNADLNDPLATALEELGLTPVDRTNVIDDDIAGLLVTQIPKFIDLLELRVLETCLNAFIASPSSQAWEDYKVERRTVIKDTQTLLDWKWQQFRAKWAQNNAPAVGRMDRATRHNLRTGGYWAGGNRT